MVVASPAIAALRARAERDARDAGARRPWVSPAIPFVGLLVLLASARWAVLASHAGPPGMDPGNWLAFGNALLGHPVRSSAIVYPPLIPFLSLASVRLFGVSSGLDVLATLASLAPGVGLFVLLRLCGLRYSAVVAAALLSASSSVGEAAAWGGYPELISLGFLFAVLGCARLLLTTGQVRWALATAFLLLGALASNELIGVAAGAASALLTIYHLIVLRPACGWTARRAVASIAIVAAPSLFLVPTYVTLISTVLAAHQAAARTNLSISALAGAAAFQFRELPWFWSVAVAGAIFSAISFPLWAREPAIATGWVLLCTTVLLVIGTSEPRFMYLLPAAAVVSTAGLIGAAQRRFHPPRLTRVAVTSVCVLLCLTAAVAGLRYYQQQVTFYGQLTPSDVDALMWLRDSTSTDTVVAVTRAGTDFTLGWWVEGLAERHAVYDADLGNLNYADERARALVAQSIFAPGSTLQEMCTSAEGRGIAYLYLAKSWPGYQQLNFSSVDRSSIRLLRNTNSLLMVQCLQPATSP